MAQKSQKTEPEKKPARGRRTTAPAEQQGPEFVGATPPAIAQIEAGMNLALREAEGNAQALAEQLGYEGSLTVGALEDEIRFYQRRSVEACLELGKRLLILKELTPHGEFKHRVELLGIEERMARRFMAATAKFANRASTPVLSAAGTQTKLLELLVLDDEEIAALEAGESARGITLDEIETMTVSELRAALREERDEAKAKDRLLEDKNKKLDELAKMGRKSKVAPWPEEVAGLKDDIANLGKILDEALGKNLTVIDAIEAAVLPLEEDAEEWVGYKTVVLQIDAQVERICTLAAGLRNEFETRLGGLVEIDKTHKLD